MTTLNGAEAIPYCEVPSGEAWLVLDTKKFVGIAADEKLVARETGKAVILPLTDEDLAAIEAARNELVEVGESVKAVYARLAAGGEDAALLLALAEAAEIEADYHHGTATRRLMETAKLTYAAAESVIYASHEE
jgi:small ligand-binding sensory domain FIST